MQTYTLYDTQIQNILLYIRFHFVAESNMLKQQTIDF
jgi:hypothetical protein